MITCSFFESKDDFAKLKNRLGEKIFNAYMKIKTKIPSNSVLNMQYPAYTIEEIERSDKKFKEFSKKYIKLRNSNLITGIGKKLFDKYPDTVILNDYEKSFQYYNEMRNYVIETFDNFRNFEKLKNLKKDDIIDFIDSYESVGETIAKAKEGAKLLYDDEEWEVYKITTYPAAQYYGKGTKWCITGNYPGHQDRGESYFNGYIRDNNLDGGYYFYINKTDPTKKFCLLQDNDNEVRSIWDAPDTMIGTGRVDNEDIASLPEVDGINLTEEGADLKKQLDQAYENDNAEEWSYIESQMNERGDYIDYPSLIQLAEDDKPNIFNMLIEWGLEINKKDINKIVASIYNNNSFNKSEFLKKIDLDYEDYENILYEIEDNDYKADFIADFPSVGLITAINSLGSLADLKEEINNTDVYNDLIEYDSIESILDYYQDEDSILVEIIQFLLENDQELEDILESTEDLATACINDKEDYVDFLYQNGCRLTKEEIDEVLDYHSFYFYNNHVQNVLEKCAKEINYDLSELGIS